jgi:kojibiose phosphorylase
MSDDAVFSDTLTVSDDGWRLVETGWDPVRSVAVGSNFMVGNGYLGYRGTTAEQGPEDFVALVVSDTYDCADGHWRELTTAPNPLYVSASVAGRPLVVSDATRVETTLDLSGGEFGSTAIYTVGEAEIRITVDRIASYADLSLIAQRWTLRTTRDMSVEMTAGIDGRVWDLNGVHLPDVTFGQDQETLIAFGTTVESGVSVAVAAHVDLAGTKLTDATGAFITGIMTVDPSAPLVIETVAAVSSSNDGGDPTERTVGLVRQRHDLGYEHLRDLSRARWSSIWAATDVRIEGSVLDDAALRFSNYHNRICTPAHTAHLPIGARGLSCQAYQGSAFWDQEVYNLPAFLFSEPGIARALLVYRHRTLDGARRKAARLGYDGAYYAWISGDTGDELCPDVFFSDVLTGREIRNHFNVWQIHVAPDIVTTVARYVAVTGDIDFLLEHGAEIAFEVARFLRSFVRYNDWRDVYHCIRLLGPDEWHENVDDNAFTNYQVRAALDFAIETWDTMQRDHSDRLRDLAISIGLRAEEVEAWRRVRDRLLLPQPDPSTLVIEQFDGFFDLEDISPDELRERLIDPSEYWGWPNGIAVRTQVSKQADVAMLMWMQPDQFTTETVRANYEYYEPRCSHNSSLSHAAYGMISKRTGKLDEALHHYRATARVDLLNTNHAVVAGTFIGGIHTAACGGTNQLVVQGFGGLGFDGGNLTVDPRLPPDWSSLRYPVTWRNQRLVVVVDHELVTVTADETNTATVNIRTNGTDLSLAPGATAETICGD